MPPENEASTRAKDEVRSCLRAIHGAYASIWADFLQNRWSQAEEKAAALLRILGSLSDEDKDAETWVTEADYSHILGATRGNDSECLLRALVAYDRSLSSPGGEQNANAWRMRAETLLRLHRYEEAFSALGEMPSRFPTPFPELEAAPFRMRHDAELCSSLAKAGRLEAKQAQEAAEALRAVAGRVEALWGPGDPRKKWWPEAGQLDPADAALLQKGLFGRLGKVAAPYSQAKLSSWAPAAKREPLNAAVDWKRVEEEYVRDGITVIDDLFSAEALEELWDYAREATCFCTVRRGYLGAFPGDGNAHPILVNAAMALEQKMSRILAGHPLGLWWFFKYTQAGTAGIGIHADAAAVNFNIWLTPDEGRVSGGGLDVYMKLPPDEAAISEYNRDFATEEEEAAVRKNLLEVGGARHIDYKRNRAVVFVSDLFHASEPFQFKEGQPRINLTLLFGDRVAARAPVGPAQGDGEGAPAPAAMEPGWDLFS